MRKIALIPALLALSALPVMAQDAVDGPGPNLVITVADASGAPKGTITLDLLEDVAPNHVARLVELAEAGDYNGVVFHRVIDGFMAQTGDVRHGRADGDTSRAGTGGSDKPNLRAEFSDLPFERGTVGMARSMDPDSANSQFFINFAPAHFLNGEYTVIGQLVDGWDVLDSIKRGDARANGAVRDPDQMLSVTVERAE
ncbi:peptidylprolyl isomerase [Paracoccus sp. (in: a-proteobacteria)]|uniref:peptidylprolyl isomerase n=1 Tax=Paracoccus sp. TaxID=267 RepID=UPI0026DF7DC1|nr:peptidylprolyl isomerase [Paracoccus sp. (in: a-proteobacteria)]MDO5646707.1 peptidylprolyl isomerase [Paracoccus sp. (in: a-proteobacteria)]